MDLNFSSNKGLIRLKDWLSRQHAKINYSLITYLLLFTLLLIAGAISFTHFFPQSDTLLLGLASILAVYTIAVLIIHELPNMQSFEFGPTKVKAVFHNLSEKAFTIKEEEPSSDVIAEIQSISNSDVHPSAVFLNLAIEFEKKLSRVAQANGFSSNKYTPVPQVIAYLQDKSILTDSFGHLLRDFWEIRNKVAHGRLKLTSNDLTEAIETGKIILTKLDKISKGQSLAKEPSA